MSTHLMRLTSNTSERELWSQMSLIVHRHTHNIRTLIPRKLPRALDEFKPDMVVYNAGTDVLAGDPLGMLDITPDVRQLMM